MKSGALTGNLMVLTTILIYSFNTNFMKVLMPDWIDAQGLVLARCTVSLIGFWIIGFFIKEKSGNKPKRKDIGMMLLGGILGLGGNLLLYITGLALTGPVDAFVIRTSQPIIVLALAVIFLGAHFTRYKAIGILLGIAGTLYVSLMPHGGNVKDSFTGDALVFAATISNSLFLILIKPYTQKFNAFTVMKWMSLSAFIIALPFGFRQLAHARIFFGEASGLVWFELCFTLIMATMVAYFLSVKALNYVSPFVESIYIYLLPVTGAIVTILMGLQKFSWHDPIALALIIGGFILVNKPSTPKYPHKIAAKN